MKRTEQDVIGKVEIDDSVYYGINTQRAVENFRISGISPDSDHVVSMAQIKRSAAIANFTGKKLPAEKKDLVVRACDRIIAGEFHDNFVLDVFQAGAGTSFNMNANEVIANVALEIGGRKKGSYEFIHPNDHVNMSQSTNDVFPTMIRITSVRKARRLLVELRKIKESLDKKAIEFSSVVKPGRTHLQDAAPVTLGMEMSAYAYTVDRGVRDLEKQLDFLLDLNIGGTAVGTGINTAPGYRDNVVKEIAGVTGEPFRSSSNIPRLVEFQSDF